MSIVPQLQKEFSPASHLNLSEHEMNMRKESNTCRNTVWYASYLM